jgi:hypothetical protein
VVVRISHEVWTVGDRNSSDRPSLVFTLGVVQPQRRSAPRVEPLMSWAAVGEVVAAGLDVNKMLKQMEGQRNATQPEF